MWIFFLIIMHKFHLGYSPPNRNQVSRNLKTIYEHHYLMLKEELKQVSWLSITLDFWSNRRNQSFLCITGHWYTDSIDPVSKIIEFSLFENRHTGIEISKAIKEKLVALNIYEKIICITCDGAENMVLACQLLDGNFTRIWCYAHRLHLVVINALGFWLPENKLNSDSNVQISSDARIINSTNTLPATSSSGGPSSINTTTALPTTNGKFIALTTDSTTAAATTESTMSVSFDDEYENEHMDVYNRLNDVLDASKSSHFVQIFMC